ncbi:ATP-binding cassette domain-containing protein [Streptomyces sp. MMG1533]|uniref:ATP-binding cassette domain-containing protein n=1 Tax=Streptomyces sp. MMG1533 TaxID=1415546 RepID=UPI00099B782F|nr:ATP-binding cassette domain-containing protein [Streptomyces sp. MMG1533]
MYASRSIDRRSSSATVRPGELLALLGPSGSGTTTAPSVLAGFEHPYSGEVLVDGEDITRVPAHHRDAGTVFRPSSRPPRTRPASRRAAGRRPAPAVAGVDVLVRPEAMGVRADDAGDARVVATAFLGGATRVTVRLADGTGVKADLPAHEAAALGAGAAVSVPLPTSRTTTGRPTTRP